MRLRHKLNLKGKGDSQAMKNYEVLIVIFAGLGIAYYMARKTANKEDAQPIGNVKLVSVQSSCCAFSTIPPCCVGTGGVKLQPTTMIPASDTLVPPEIV